ncbi:hypothetical protein KPA97_67780, partial [Burkholderia cenocepacia]|nr:hypothetical protein [Burkholderia cenocepacia]
AEVLALQADLAAARDSLREVRAVRTAEDREYMARAALRKQFAQLKKLDDFMKPADRDGRATRLVSLFGDSKGDLAWYRDQWSDPGTSGAGGECYPAT